MLHVVGDSKFGGGSVIISQIVVAQKEKGYDVSVLTTDREFISHLQSKGINTHHVDCIWRSYNLFKDVLGVFRLVTFLNRDEFDVVHTHTTKAGFIGRIAGRISGCKNIFHTVHGFPFSENSSLLKVRIFAIIEKFLARFTHRLIFVSDYHRKWAKDLGIISNNSNAISIRNGVNAPSISGDKVKVLKEKFGNKISIVFVGRIVREKGVFDLLHAFSILKDSIKGAQLFFVGDGPDFEKLKDEACGEDGVYLTGFVKNPADYLTLADIFVLPSYREGLSISALEAQALGVPSILSNVGGNIEISDNGKSALIFDVGCISALVQKLSCLLSDEKLCERLRLSSNENFNDNFTSEKMTTEYNNLCEEIQTK
ncbi:glycosyltransferase family 4 protein [Aliikangiella maris]|uniref:Glycosyltransferase family 4 protein n=2 Tax=Aliikangiella maris TaxID=3162458 RepID=A0ABV3MHZ8_9GAMM